MKILYPVFSLLFFLTFTAHADTTIDYQWAVCDKSPKAVLQKLEAGSPAPDKTQSITYYDSATARYIRDGVTFRTKSKGKKAESSVKVHFSAQTEVPSADCKWDRYGSETLFTCEVTNKLKSNDPLWSTAQSDFLAKYYKPVSVSDLKSFGPYDNKKWTVKLHGQEVVFDTVDTDEAGHLMEFSLEVPYDMSSTAYAEFTAWFQSKGIVLCPKQEGKTARLFRAMGILKP